MKLHVFRLAGITAIVGGTLRVVAPLAPSLGEGQAQWVYLVVDVFLLLGLIGIYGLHTRSLGRVGLIGFCGSLIGICLIRCQGMIGDWAYPAGAGLFSIGMAVIGVKFLLNNALSRPAPMLWIAALVVGLTRQLWPDGMGLLIAGELFGLGFIAAGVALARDPRGSLP